MGSKSKSSNSASTTTATTNTSQAWDQSQTIDAGSAILDSIIIDPSDEVAIEAMTQLRAGFERLAYSSTANLYELSSLGKQLMESVENGAMSMRQAGNDALKNYLAEIDTMMDAGILTVRLGHETVSDALALAGDVSMGGQDLTAEALGVVANVQTGDYLASLKTVSAMVVLMGLGSIALTRGAR